MDILETNFTPSMSCWSVATQALVELIKPQKQCSCKEPKKDIYDNGRDKYEVGELCLICGLPIPEPKPNSEGKIERLVVSFTDKSAMSFQEQAMMNKINELVEAWNNR